MRARDFDSLDLRNNNATLLKMLQYHVGQTEKAYGDIFVEDQMRCSDTLFGKLSAHARRPLHSVVRFYVELFAERQAAFNYVLAKALATFSKELDKLAGVDSERELEEMRSSITSLSERATQLERKIEVLQRTGRSKA